MEFGNSTYSDRDLTGIAALVSFWAKGKGIKIDGRRYSAAAIGYAVNQGYIEKTVKGYFTGGDSHIRPDLTLPIGAIWRIVEPAITEHSNYEITYSRMWNVLNLTQNHSGKTHNLTEIEAVLINLDMWGYIHFNAAGKIWRIDVKPTPAIDPAFKA